MTVAERWLSPELSQFSQLSQVGSRTPAKTEKPAEAPKKPSVQGLTAGRASEKEEEGFLREREIQPAKPAKVAKVALDPADSLDFAFATTLRKPAKVLGDEARAAMWRDITIVVQDLLAEGKKPGQIRRMFGLSWTEINQIRKERF